MKEFVNKRGSVLKYDENAVEMILCKKGENDNCVVFFTADEVLEFITKTGLWDGFNFELFEKGPLNLHSWILAIKDFAKWSPQLNNFVSKSEGGYLSNYDIALKIRNMIDTNTFIIPS